MLDKKVISSVFLPAWVYEGAINEQEIMRNACRYLNRIPQRYPGYKVLEVNNGIAKCERCED
ncbi:hypothetical protein BK704_35035 [[Bacillus thuringiensis] serovar konkukian]|nr:hypothetical protein [Bacillus thuringiensis]MED1304584.1 hypothetical protein [Bacillus pacificus]OUA91557.1 hypothetical protein BK704_35035 [[Bacillus thuringiensis] serovar konkukian]